MLIAKSIVNTVYLRTRDILIFYSDALQYQMENAYLSVETPYDFKIEFEFSGVQTAFHLDLIKFKNPKNLEGWDEKWIKFLKTIREEGVQDLGIIFNLENSTELCIRTYDGVVQFMAPTMNIEFEAFRFLDCFESLARLLSEKPQELKKAFLRDQYTVEYNKLHYRSAKPSAEFPLCGNYCSSDDSDDSVDSVS